MQISDIRAAGGLRVLSPGGVAGGAGFFGVVAGLRANQAKLAAILEGPKREDVAAAMASLEAAQARLAGMQTGSRDDELAAAQGLLDSSQLRLDRLMNPDSREVAVAQAAVQSA